MRRPTERAHLGRRYGIDIERAWRDVIGPPETKGAAGCVYFKAPRVLINYYIGPDLAVTCDDGWTADIEDGVIIGFRRAE